MRFTNRRSSRLAFFAATALLLSFPPATARSAPPEVNGRVEQIGEFRLLRVWGTPEEMGFAHGYLLADGVVTVINASCDSLAKQGRASFDDVLAQMLPFVEIPERYLRELKGIIAGMKARKGSLPTLKALGRPIRLDDLIFHNAGDMIRAFGCSGFTVWGDQAGPLGVMTTRNFDYPIASPAMHAEHLLIVRQPEGRRQVLSIAWPSYLGTFTGLNDDGVSAFMHDGTGGAIRKPDRKRVPLPLVLADALERSTKSDAAKNINTSLRTLQTYPFSYMVRVATSRVEDDVPAHVFRIDKSGVGENPLGMNRCITTNHYLTRNGKPAAQAYKGSLSRYQKLEDRLSTTMTREAAWAAQAVVASDNQDFPTLHTLVVCPEKRLIDLAFAKWKSGKVVPATKFNPTTINFDELFPKQPDP